MYSLSSLFASIIDENSALCFLDISLNNLFFVTISCRLNKYNGAINADGERTMYNAEVISIFTGTMVVYIFYCRLMGSLKAEALQIAQSVRRVK